MSFTKAKRLAEKRIAAFIVKRAKGRFACWDLIRRLRCPSQTVAIDAYSMIEHFEEVFHDPRAPMIFDVDQLGLSPPDFL
jgi:hypothetical protein